MISNTMKNTSNCYDRNLVLTQSNWAMSMISSRPFGLPCNARRTPPPARNSPRCL